MKTKLYILILHTETFHWAIEALIGGKSSFISKCLEMNQSF